MYDLLVQGLTDLTRATALLGQRKVSRDPLSGTADGLNCVFHTQYYPVLTSGSLAAFDSLGVSLSVSSVDYDSGEVVLASAPTAQPSATYTMTPYTTGQLASFLIAGFDEMMARWPRENWFLSASDAAYVAGAEDAAHLYLCYIDSSTGVPADPQCSGSTPFSKLRTQIAFFIACCQYAFVARQHVENSLSGIDFRESRGAAINRTAIPKNLAEALTRLNEEVIRAMKSAQDQYYSDGAHLGGNVAPYSTEDYEENFQWQDS